jgi:hypothetical protein
MLAHEDIAAIEQLNAQYALAIDGLVADAATAWAATFAPDGVFSILDRQRTPIVPETRGRAALATLHTHFTGVATTRHWYNNLRIEPDADSRPDDQPLGAGMAGRGGTHVTTEPNLLRARMTCYVIAIDIQRFPAGIIRSGIYQDRLVRVDGEWLFHSRVLILDPGSPVG